MQVIYTDKEIKEELISFFDKEKVKASLEFTESAEEILARSRERPFPGGGAPPEGFIDVGKYFISLILSDELARGVLAAAAYNLIKKIILHFKRSAAKSNKEFAIITDKFDAYNCIKTHSKSIYFIVPVTVSDKDIKDAIRKIPIIRKKLIELLKLVDFPGFTMFEVIYSIDTKEWLINLYY